MIVFHADHALLPAGLKAGVRVGVSDGLIRTVEEAPAQAGDVRIAGLVLPGMANVHSHAFQRAMARRCIGLLSGLNLTRS
jgi:cytosine/adenosine deaminase-related metal-dependent hydrolase